MNNLITIQNSWVYGDKILIEDYIEDEASDNWSTLIVWENPDYQETK